MGSVSLPENFSLDDAVFAEASPHQRILAWRINGESWAPPMTIDEYVGREQTLSETELSRDGGTKYYVLYHRDDTNMILSSCESTRKQAFVADAAGGSRIVDAYAIASVFTDPRFRQHGLASHMLRELQKAVDGDEQAAECGALYSDIGRSFYTRMGWRDARSPQVALKMEPDFQPPASASASASPSSGVEVSLLTGPEIAALCDRDTQAMKQRFDSLAAGAVKDGGSTHVAFVPSYAQFSWHFARDAYVARAVLKREMRFSGAATADGTAWLCWDHDVREKKLKILRIVVAADSSPPSSSSSPSEAWEKRATANVKALLEAALREAHDWGLPKVLIWEPDSRISNVATDLWREHGPHLQVVFDERESGSIPSLRWRGGKEIPGLVWESNEYYAWC
jgi:GNAT superfamily N-acetyltransferase